jgi:thiamine kinase-like enzyme
MSKTRNKSHSEIDHWKGLLREAHSTIKSLRKKLRQYEKYDEEYKNLEVYCEKCDNNNNEDLINKTCVHCDSQHINIIDLGKFTLIRCQSCGKKEKQT